MARMVGRTDQGSPQELRPFKPTDAHFLRHSSHSRCPLELVCEAETSPKTGRFQDRRRAIGQAPQKPKRPQSCFPSLRAVHLASKERALQPPGRQIRLTCPASSEDLPHWIRRSPRPGHWKDGRAIPVFPDSRKRRQREHRKVRHNLPSLLYNGRWPEIPHPKLPFKI